MMAKKSIFGLALLLGATAANADQPISVKDGGEVGCVLSLRGITRIAPINDAFVSDIRRSASDPSIDLSVANEPNRGDLYVSLPDGYMSGQPVSFFTITRKSMVYKFKCVVSDVESQQIFLRNPDLDALAASERPQSTDPWDKSVGLIQAMAEGRPADGFTVDANPARPVQVGKVRVQVMSVYTGVDRVGKKIAIKNMGSSVVKLDDNELRPTGTIAAEIQQKELKPQEETYQYIILAKQP